MRTLFTIMLNSSSNKQSQVYLHLVHLTGREQLTLSSVNVVGIHESLTGTRQTSFDNTPKYNCCLVRLKVNNGKSRYRSKYYLFIKVWGSPTSHNALSMAMMSRPKKQLSFHKALILRESALHVKAKQRLQSSRITLR